MFAKLNLLQSANLNYFMLQQAVSSKDLIAVRIVDYIASVTAKQTIQQFFQILQQAKAVFNQLKSIIENTLEEIQNYSKKYMLRCVLIKQTKTPNLQEFNTEQSNFLNNIYRSIQALSKSQYPKDIQKGSVADFLLSENAIGQKVELSEAEEKKIKEWSNKLKSQKQMKYKMRIDISKLRQELQKNFKTVALQKILDLSNKAVNKITKIPVKEEEMLKEQRSYGPQQIQIKQQRKQEIKKTRRKQNLPLRIKQKKTIRELRQFPLEKSFNIEFQVIYIETKFTVWNKNQYTENVRFLLADNTGIAIGFFKNHEEIYQGNMVFMLDAIVRQYKGMRRIQSKFRDPTIRASPYKFDRLDFSYNLYHQQFKIHPEDYLTKIISLKQPPYQNINIKAKIIKVYNEKDDQIKFLIADDTASILAIFPSTFLNIEEDRVFYFFHVNAEMYDQQVVIKNGEKTQLDKCFIDYETLNYEKINSQSI